MLRTPPRLFLLLFPAIYKRLYDRQDTKDATIFFMADAFQVDRRIRKEKEKKNTLYINNDLNASRPNDKSLLFLFDQEAEWRHMPSHTTTTSICTIIYYVVTCAHYYDSGSYYNINCHNELQEIPTLLLFYNPPPRILVIHGLSMKNHVTTEVE